MQNCEPDWVANGQSFAEGAKGADPDYKVTNTDSAGLQRLVCTQFVTVGSLTASRRIVDVVRVILRCCIRWLEHHGRIERVLGSECRMVGSSLLD